MKQIKPAIKCNGSCLSKWIISHFPENYEQANYIEPYCGGANVIISKKKSTVEVINDIDLPLINIYRALRDESKEFIRRLNLCKYTEETFQKSLEKTSDDYLEIAINEFIARKMSRSEAKKNFLATRNNENSAWKNAISYLPDLAERLNDVFICNKKAIDVIQAFNDKQSVIYCDPPYLYETNSSKKVYDSELKTEDHIDLAFLMNNFKGKAIVSGCLSPLYSRLYKNWNMEKKKTTTKDKKDEIIWKNY